VKTEFVTSKDVSMQVFTRSIGEKLVIAENIVVSVLAIYGDMVRLGIKAAPEVSVVRDGPKRLRRTGDERTAALGGFKPPHCYSDLPSAE
jgi:carbon storage regulator CsrA